VNLRYVARANGATDPIVVIVATIVVIALRHGGCAITVMIQIAYAHSGSDACRHRRYVLQGQKKTIALILANVSRHFEKRQ